MSLLHALFSRLGWRTLLLCMLVAGGMRPAAGSTGTLFLEKIVAAEAITSRSIDTYDVYFTQAHAGLVDDVVHGADEARRSVARTMRDAFLVRITIVIAPDTAALTRMAGGWAEHSAAVAVPSEQLVIINADSVRQSGVKLLLPVLTHELAHLYVGLRSFRPPPRWLDEGIAMRVAGEWTTQDAAAMAMAGLSGSLIPLRDLQHRFPHAQDRQQLAYRQAYSAVDHLIETRFDGSLTALMLQLAKPGELDGADLFWSPHYRQALEGEWIRSLKGWEYWFLLTLDSGIVWWIAALLTVAGAIVIKRRRRLAAAVERAELAAEGIDPDSPFGGEEAWDDESDDEPPPEPRRPYHRPGGRF